MKQTWTRHKLLQYSTLWQIQMRRFQIHIPQNQIIHCLKTLCTALLSKNNPIGAAWKQLWKPFDLESCLVLDPPPAIMPNSENRQITRWKPGRYWFIWWCIDCCDPGWLLRSRLTPQPGRMGWLQGYALLMDCCMPYCWFTYQVGDLNQYDNQCNGFLHNGR